MTLADSMETLEEFEELNAEGEERQEASAERGHEAAPLPALAPGRRIAQGAAGASP